jgi:hypothetical protein
VTVTVDHFSSDENLLWIEDALVFAKSLFGQGMKSWTIKSLNENGSPTVK